MIKCKVCSKQFEYGDSESPMLTGEKWNEVVKFYGLEKFEKQAFFRSNFPIEDETAHLFICKDCMEDALGRKLTEEDLNGSLFNYEFIVKYFKYEQRRNK